MYTPRLLPYRPSFPLDTVIAAIRTIDMSLALLYNVLFDIRTVAEGIESMDQVEYLKRIGCDYVQGYVFYRPMSQSDYEMLLTQGC